MCSTESMPRYIYSIGSSVMDTKVEIDTIHPKIIGENQHVLASGFQKVQGIGFHYEEELVYLSDTVQDAIYLVPVEGGPTKELTVQTKMVLGMFDKTLALSLAAHALYGISLQGSVLIGLRIKSTGLTKSSII